MYRTLFLIGMLGLSAPASAQETAPASPPAASPDTRQPKEKAPIVGRHLACRDAAKQKGLKSLELNDEIAVCLEEAKLDCLKQAVAQKARGPERKTFMEACMAKPS